MTRESSARRICGEGEADGWAAQLEEWVHFP
jgi:hypothetical protein